jgi:hypothetical protein
MKKELKDYLHLYLGCRIKSKGGKCGDLVSVSNDGMSIVVYDKDKINDPRGLCIYSDWLLLVLRPLSDMTREEKSELNEIKERHWTSDLKYQAVQVKWHLSKHFDLFGLIEAGLAIDSTTLK